MKKLTKTEVSLLLYFETVAVDQLALVDTLRMNQEDMVIANQWDKEKFVGFKRWTQRDSSGEIKALTYKVSLSDEAWKIAHKERKARAVRMITKHHGQR